VKLSLKNLFLNNVQIKVFSLVFGYLAWSIISHSHADDAWVQIPVCFSNSETAMKITAPEMVRVNLAGKRSDLRSLDTNATAVHIDTRDLRDGEQSIELSEQHVLTPDSIQVVGWAPTHINVIVKKEHAPA
jgi:hypothetical protein